MTDNWDEYLDTDDDDGNGCYPRRSMEDTERINAKQEFELQSALRRSKHRILQANFQAEQRNLRVIRLIPEPAATPVAVRKRLQKQNFTPKCPFIDYEAIDVDDVHSPVRYEADGSDSDNSSDAMPTPDRFVSELRIFPRHQKPLSKSNTSGNFASLTQSSKNFESDGSSYCSKKCSLKNGPCVRQGTATCDDGPIANQNGQCTESVHTDDSFESDEESVESDEESVESDEESVESDEESFESQQLLVSKSATIRPRGHRGTSLAASIDSEDYLELDDDSVF